MKILLASIISLTCNIQKNKVRIIELIQKHSGTADMILFGESFLQGFYSMSFRYEDDIKIALPLDSSVVSEIKEAAKVNKIGVSFGMLELINKV